MKKVLHIFLFALMVGAGTTISTEAKSQAVSVSFSVFYNSLKPYGRWMNNSTYGHVWVSNQRDFTPYSTGGHWAYTDYGWTWVSDYDWGWAPFHYGRWAYHATYGWYWIPGYQWAPAWVAWRNNNDYYGWAPLSPGIDISIGVSAYSNIPSGRWVFAPHRYITSPDINRYYVPRNQNVTIIRRTTVINNVNVRNNVRYVSGPRRQDVERENHTKVQVYKVASSSRPGRTEINKNTVNVYRPVINNNKTVINNNKTTVNKNSNNTTVNKNSNNKTSTKNTTVNKNSNNKTSNKPINKNNNNKPNNKPGNKKPQQTKPANNPPNHPDQTTNNKQQERQVAQHEKVQAQRQQMLEQRRQQAKQAKQQAQKKKPPTNAGGN